MSFGSTEFRSTDFAITTVNVPDRLDLRDMDDRKQTEDDSRRRRFDFGAIRAWIPRLIGITVLGAIGYGIYVAFDTWHESLSPGQMSQRLSASLGVPVKIEATQFSFSPTPRLILTKVGIDGKVVLDEISLNLESRQILQIVQGRHWNWGDAVVGPATMDLEQCRGLFKLVPHLDAALPSSISSLHFHQLQVSDQPWLAGEWEIDLTRKKGVGFASAVARLKRDKGSLEIDVTPTANPDVVAFQMEAINLLLPFGPAFAVEEAIANGNASPAGIELSHFSVGGPFGAVQGSLTASLDTRWEIQGVMQSEGVDLAALVRQVAPPPESKEEAPNEPEPVIQGTASFAGQIAGKGATLADATAHATFTAPVGVRWPVVNGINLGFVATQPGASVDARGGTTRFSTLEAQITANSEKIVIRDIHARAGALAVLGQVSLTPDHALSGLLHVDLGTTRVLAPIRVGVHGNLRKPEFGS